MAIRITLLFQLGRSTWGEAHYWGAGSDPDGAQEQAAATKLAQLRSGLCGANCSIFAARLTSPTIFRNVTTIRFNPPLTGFVGGQQEENLVTADVPNTSVMVSVKTKNQGKSFRTYLAGCIDEAIETNPDFPANIVPDPNFTAPFNKFSAYLLGQGAWGTVVKTNPQQQMVAPPVVTNAQYPGLVGVTLPAPLVTGGNALAVGDHLQIRNFRRKNLSSPDLNGKWQIGAVLAGAGTVVTYFLNGSNGVDPTNFWKYGVAQTIVGVYDPYIIYDWDRVVSRRRGGSIEQPRGKSRTRRSRM